LTEMAKIYIIGVLGMRINGIFSHNWNVQD
jgi:hypothetical protein